ncbi:uncharacterized protein LOC143074406 [Mytilus galloprovincialis]|uniref:Chitin-binding type-2 domain-containing protein n=1 Tax=Mytilus galloprovincialis TaxID=29158 RepID=A0A8B6D0P6_MYTGA|nr:Hypothetical predicted protein [Mytilus galloprovincialis]
MASINMVPVLTVVLFVLACSSGLKERRRRGICIDTWSNIPNPCLSNPNNTIYFPHPGDIRKFIQCDMLGRMYIIQCPSGEKYDFKASCKAENGARPPIVTRMQAINTDAITHTTPPTNINTRIQNPCTNANMAKGLMYFPHPEDPHKFIQCEQSGNALVDSCNGSLVWNQQRLACVYNIQPGVGQSTTTTPFTIGTTSSNSLQTNPCHLNAVTADQLFHPHPNPHKFYQCDVWGDVYESDCPTGLIWNDAVKTCSAPFVVG